MSTADLAKRYRRELAAAKARSDQPISPDIAMHALLVKLYADRGAVELGYTADLYLRGIKTALAACIGPEAARKTFKRHSEETE